MSSEEETHACEQKEVLGKQNSMLNSADDGA